MSMKRLMEAQVNEMLRHKWIESEKAGHDLGDACMLQWIREHAAEFRHAYNIKHMETLDDGTAVQAVMIYPDDNSINAIFDAFALPDTFSKTRCEFGLPSSAKPYIADMLGGQATIMLTMVGYSADGIYAAGVVAGIPVACVSRIAEPSSGSASTDETEVDWVPFSVNGPIVGIVDTNPRQFS